MNVRNWLVFTSKQLTLVKESNYPAKFKSLSLRQITDRRFGGLFLFAYPFILTVPQNVSIIIPNLFALRGELPYVLFELQAIGICHR